MLLEHIIMCRLVMGNKAIALQEMSQVVSLCNQYPRLLQSHRPQIHTLIGLYAMSMNCMNEAESQFTTALKVSLHFLSRRPFDNNENHVEAISLLTKFKDETFDINNLLHILVITRKGSVDVRKSKFGNSLSAAKKRSRV